MNRARARHPATIATAIVRIQTIVRSEARKDGRWRAPGHRRQRSRSSGRIASRAS